jgi:hypothetical protein
MAGTADKVKRGLAVLRSFVGPLKVTVNDITIGLDIDAKKGSADSGELEIDLPNVLVPIWSPHSDQVGPHLRASLVQDHSRASHSVRLTYGIGHDSQHRPCEGATPRRSDAFAMT